MCHTSSSPAAGALTSWYTVFIHSALQKTTLMREPNIKKEKIGAPLECGPSQWSGNFSPSQERQWHQSLQRKPTKKLAYAAASTRTHGCSNNRNLQSVNYVNWEPLNVEILTEKMCSCLKKFFKKSVLPLLLQWQQNNRELTMKSVNQYTGVDSSAAHRAQAVPMLQFHFCYDNNISALINSRYQYQSNINTLQMIHAFRSYFAEWNESEAASSDITQLQQQ